MNKTKTGFTIALFVGLMIALPLTASAEKEMQKSFDAKKEVRLKFVLGDLLLEKSTDNKIHVHLVYEYDQMENFEPRMEDKGRYLLLEEKLRGKDNDGYSRWTVAVPDETEIEFETATGDLKIIGLNLEIDSHTGTGEIEIIDSKGEIEVHTGTGNIYATNSEDDLELNTGTGNVDVENCIGTIDASTGTGDVHIENCTGDIEASSGTGDVEASGITLEYEGKFSSGTGEAEVEFPNGNDFELTVASGTDDAVVDMKGKSIEGYFEFKCHATKGKIVSPVSFDREDEREENDNRYFIKSFTKGSNTPKVYIRTGTGTAKLVK